MLSIHPYEPYIPEGATRLIIGTMPNKRFCVRMPELDELPGTCKLPNLQPEDVNFYYGSNDNSFWKLVSAIVLCSPSPNFNRAGDVLERENQYRDVFGRFKKESL